MIQGMREPEGFSSDALGAVDAAVAAVDLGSAGRALGRFEGGPLFDAPLGRTLLRFALVGAFVSSAPSFFDDAFSAVSGLTVASVVATSCSSGMLGRLLSGGLGFARGGAPAAGAGGGGRSDARSMSGFDDLASDAVAVPISKIASRSTFRSSGLSLCRPASARRSSIAESSPFATGAAGGFAGAVGSEGNRFRGAAGGGRRSAPFAVGVVTTIGGGGRPGARIISMSRRLTGSSSRSRTLSAAGASSVGASGAFSSSDWSVVISRSLRVRAAPSASPATRSSRTRFAALHRRASLLRRPDRPSPRAPHGP